MSLRVSTLFLRPVTVSQGPAIPPTVRVLRYPRHRFQAASTASPCSLIGSRKVLLHPSLPRLRGLRALCRCVRIPAIRSTTWDLQQARLPTPVRSNDKVKLILSTLPVWFPREEVRRNFPQDPSSQCVNLSRSPV